MNTPHYLKTVIGLVLISFMLGCGSGGSSSSGNPALPADGGYEGAGAGGVESWFLIGGDGLMLMNFAFVHPNFKLDFVNKSPDKALLDTYVLGGERVFRIDLSPSGAVTGRIMGYYKGNGLFRLAYDLYHGLPNYYSGVVDCVVTHPKSGLGQSTHPNTFEDVSINTGLVNVLNGLNGTTPVYGENFCFGDISGDGAEDLFVPCSPSVYLWEGSATNGMSVYFTDNTYSGQNSKFGLPIYKEGQPYCMWADLNVDGSLDLLTGNKVYRNNSVGSNIAFALSTTYVLNNDKAVPDCAVLCDCSGDGDLDLFTGYWHSNNIKNGTETFSFVQPGTPPISHTHYDTEAAVFGPFDFDVSKETQADVDQDLVQIQNSPVWDLIISRCNRTGGPTDPVVFESVNFMTPKPDVSQTRAVIVGDVNNDMKPDIFIAGQNNYRLLKNVTDFSVPGLPDITFEEVTATAFDIANAPPASSDAEFVDYDNDGWLDLFIAGPSGTADHRLYRNITPQAGSMISFLNVTSSHDINKLTTPTGVNGRCSWCDINDDGHCDLVMGLKRLHVLKNSGGLGALSNYMKVIPLTDLNGASGLQNRLAVGAIVLIDMNMDGKFDSNLDQMRIVEAGRQNHQCVHFGLGDKNLVWIRVHFPDGSMVDVKGPNDLGVQANQTIVVHDVL